jgi:hypothetical protein
MPTRHAFENSGIAGWVWELCRVHGAIDLDPEALDPDDAVNHIQPCGQI